MLDPELPAGAVPVMTPVVPGPGIFVPDVPVGEGVTAAAPEDGSVASGG
jgi:hypothetical protein